MNQIQYTTAKKHCLFVMLPDGAHRCQLLKDEAEHSYLSYFVEQQNKQLYLQRNGYELQGFVSELTDEQKEGVVDISQKEWFTNYAEGWFQEDFTASESFASLLTSLNVLLVNPYGENEPKPIIYYENHGQNFGSERIEDWQEVIDWQTAKQHVGNYILLTCNK